MILISFCSFHLFFPCRYFSSCTSDESNLIETIVSGDWDGFVSRVNAGRNSREALTAIVTYATDEDFPRLCSRLGDRLSGHAAMLCYICAGDLEKLVECWMKNKDTGSGPRSVDDWMEASLSAFKLMIQILYNVILVI